MQCTHTTYKKIIALVLACNMMASPVYGMHMSLKARTYAFFDWTNKKVFRPFNERILQPALENKVVATAGLTGAGLAVFAAYWYYPQWRWLLFAEQNKGGNGKKNENQKKEIKIEIEHKKPDNYGSDKVNNLYVAINNFSLVGVASELENVGLKKWLYEKKINEHNQVVYGANKVLSEMLQSNRQSIEDFDKKFMRVVGDGVCIWDSIRGYRIFRKCAEHGLSSMVDSLCKLMPKNSAEKKFIDGNHVDASMTALHEATLKCLNAASQEEQKQYVETITVLKRYGADSQKKCTVQFTLGDALKQNLSAQEMVIAMMAKEFQVGGLIVSDELCKLFSLNMGIVAETLVGGFKDAVNNLEVQRVAGFLKAQHCKTYFSGYAGRGLLVDMLDKRTGLKEDQQQQWMKIFKAIVCNLQPWQFFYQVFVRATKMGHKDICEFLLMKKLEDQHGQQRAYVDGYYHENDCALVTALQMAVAQLLRANSRDAQVVYIDIMDMLLSAGADAKLVYQGAIEVGGESISDYKGKSAQQMLQDGYGKLFNEGKFDGTPIYVISDEFIEKYGTTFGLRKRDIAPVVVPQVKQEKKEEPKEKPQEKVFKPESNINEEKDEKTSIFGNVGNMVNKLQQKGYVPHVFQGETQEPNKKPEFTEKTENKKVEELRQGQKIIVPEVDALTAELSRRLEASVWAILQEQGIKNLSSEDVKNIVADFLVSARRGGALICADDQQKKFGIEENRTTVLQKIFDIQSFCYVLSTLVREDAQGFMEGAVFIENDVAKNVNKIVQKVNNFFGLGKDVQYIQKSSDRVFDGLSGNKHGVLNHIVNGECKSWMHKFKHTLICQSPHGIWLRPGKDIVKLDVVNVLGWMGEKVVNIFQKDSNSSSHSEERVPEDSIKKFRELFPNANLLSVTKDFYGELAHDSNDLAPLQYICTMHRYALNELNTFISTERRKQIKKFVQDLENRYTDIKHRNGSEIRVTRTLANVVSYFLHLDEKTPLRTWYEKFLKLQRNVQQFKAGNYRFANDIQMPKADQNYAYKKLQGMIVELLKGEELLRDMGNEVVKNYFTNLMVVLKSVTEELLDNGSQLLHKPIFEPDYCAVFVKNKQSAAQLEQAVSELLKKFREESEKLLENACKELEINYNVEGLSQNIEHKELAEMMKKLRCASDGLGKTTELRTIIKSGDVINYNKLLIENLEKAARAVGSDGDKATSLCKVYQSILANNTKLFGEDIPKAIEAAGRFSQLSGKGKERLEQCLEVVAKYYKEHESSLQGMGGMYALKLKSASTMLIESDSLEGIRDNVYDTFNFLFSNK